jgi:hypothetical protein
LHELGKSAASFHLLVPREQLRAKASKGRVRRVQPLDIEYLRAVEGTLSEWASGADEDAYRKL